MLTAVISDLHLGSRMRTDLLRRASVLDGLLEALTGVERLVLLGDTLELRDRPVRHVLELARPFLEAVGSAMRGGEVVLVPGNHDHHLGRGVIGPGAGRRGKGLGLEELRRPPAGTMVADVRTVLGCSLVVAYPGIFLADGLWATHGHYADAHSAIRGLETLIAGAGVGVRRGLRRHGLRTPADYEAVLAPTYRLFHGIAQAPRLQRAADAGKRVVRGVEVRTGGRPDPRSGVRLPLRAVDGAAAGGTRFGPVPGELRRPGVLPMTQVIRSLGVDAGTVLFGHTHRLGPVPGDPACWTTPEGIRLHNTGSWVDERSLPHGADPYCPGVVTYVDGAQISSVRRVNLMSDS